VEEVSTKTALERVQASVGAAVSGRSGLRVLDAGCGSDSARAGFPVPDAFNDAHVVGIDVSSEALDRNALLDERIVADLQSWRAPAQSYDVVVSWDVLEHLSDPMRAVRNLAQAVAPGGILVIGIPHVWSLKGLVTKLTPFWFHRFAYRTIFGLGETGTEGGPFRTHLRLTLAPVQLQGRVEELGFETKVAVVYGSDAIGEIFGSRRWLARLWDLGSRLTEAVSLGRVRANATEVAFVFERHTKS
jgi:SAM-dependent methyltransferase